MKKKLMIITGSALALGIAFGAGNMYTKATTDWQTNAINNANAAIGQVGESTATDMSKSVNTDINSAVNDKLNSSIAQQEADLQSLLEQYYQAKLNGLTNSDSFKQLQDQIVNLKYAILGQYKTQIDTMFAGK